MTSCRQIIIEFMRFFGCLAIVWTVTCVVGALLLTPWAYIFGWQ